MSTNPDEYTSYEECVANGTHLTDCDDDGYCNFCGEDTPISTGYATTFTFDATDSEHAEELLAALTDVMATSDAVPVYGRTNFTTPHEAKSWPDTDADRDAYATWQAEVANGDTLRGFREWAAELATDTDLDG